jgi:hypothetical protein
MNPIFRKPYLHIIIPAGKASKIPGITITDINDPAVAASALKTA